MEGGAHGDSCLEVANCRVGAVACPIIYVLIPASLDLNPWHPKGKTAS